jgi:hypothetical protein
MPVGTYSLEDLKAVTNVSAADFGLDNILATIQVELQNHNVVVNEMISNLCEINSDAQAAWGGTTDGTMQEVDEFASSPTQKTLPPGVVGFPLRKFDYTIGWTSDLMERATPAKLAEMTVAAEIADIRNLRRQIAIALFRPTPYTWFDRLETQLSYSVRPFINAGGDQIPAGPAGETFNPASHTHFVANASVDATVLRTAINNLVEHGHGNLVTIMINRAQAAAVAALTGFVAVQPANIIIGANTNVGVGQLDISRTDERLIGYFDGYPVFTRSWVPNNYVFISAIGDTRKSLRFRQPPQASLQGFRLESSEKAHPLYVNVFERYVGFAPRTLTNGVCVFFGGGSYVQPTI